MLEMIERSRELAPLSQFRAALRARLDVIAQRRGRLVGVAVEESFELVWK
jgi:hypothetical protein